MADDESRQKNDSQGSLPPVFVAWNSRLQALAGEAKNAEEYGITLVIHRWVDETLVAAIHTKFVGDTKGSSAKLFKYPGGLSSFSARVHLGRCLGIFGSITYADLKTINDIRNDFAHPPNDAGGEMMILGFDHEQIRAKCDKLKFLDHVAQTVPTETVNTTGKDRFFATANQIAMNLWSIRVVTSEMSTTGKGVVTEFGESLLP